MSKTLAKSKLRTPILFICLAFLIPRFGLAEDFLDRLMERCSKGDMQACDEINELTDKHREQIERLNDQADRFHAEVPSLGIEKRNIPNFKKAYPIILQHYMVSDTIEPVHRQRGLNKKFIEICAKHFYDLFFKYGKDIPKTETSDTDWGMIYLMTIEHYFRFCSKRIEQGSLN
ncbi:MAG: hypothetical protein KAW47_04950 [Thermoplasmatales archaeon]|nr:hypothetical protein [Thermoplasmatales archaeon]